MPAKVLAGAIRSSGAEWFAADGAEIRGRFSRGVTEKHPERVGVVDGAE